MMRLTDASRRPRSALQLPDAMGTEFSRGLADAPELGPGVSSECACACACALTTGPVHAASPVLSTAPNGARLLQCLTRPPAAVRQAHHGRVLRLAGVGRGGAGRGGAVRGGAARGGAGASGCRAAHRTGPRCGTPVAAARRPARPRPRCCARASAAACARRAGCRPSSPALTPTPAPAPATGPSPPASPAAPAPPGPPPRRAGPRSCRASGGRRGRGGRPPRPAPPPAPLRRVGSGEVGCEAAGPAASSSVLLHQRATWGLLCMP